ncbi:MAG: hypothetical protein K2I72_00170 [Bacilli bacterium]|nr:hypothetical protein [Bacilli bacterium]
MDNFLCTNGYVDELLITKIFCELITPDKMLEAYSKRDMSIIETELLKINPDSNTYHQLMELVNNFGDMSQEYVNNGNHLEFTNEIASQYREAFTQSISQYMYSENANFDDYQIERICRYLNAIGTNTNEQATVYFNERAKELSYEGIYNSGLEETSNYHY